MKLNLSLFAQHSIRWLVNVEYEVALVDTRDDVENASNFGAPFTAEEGICLLRFGKPFRITICGSFQNGMAKKTAKYKVGR